MNLIKKFYLLLALFLAASAPAQQNPDLSASSITQKMKAYIGFNDALTPRIQEINEVFVAKAIASKKSSGERKEKMGGIKEADMERTASLKTILSDAEFKKFEQFRKENRKEMKEKLQERKAVPE